MEVSSRLIITRLCALRRCLRREKNTPPLRIYREANPGGSIRIDEDSGQKHTAEVPVGLSIGALKALGYRWVKIDMTLDVKAQDTGNGRCFWLDIDGARRWGAPNSDPSTDISWKDWHTINHFTKISIDYFREDGTSTFRFGFNQSREYPFTDAIWFAGTMHVTFTVSKN
jgi:hypothetical protein